MGMQSSVGNVSPTKAERSLDLLEVCVIEKKEGGKYTVDSGTDNKPTLFCSYDDAEYVMAQMSEGHRHKRSIRLATEYELSAGVMVKPKRKAATRAVCLVEVYEDLEQRKYAISSRAESESEFITEFAIAFSSMGIVDPVMAATRIRELIPLVVDIACKYRGYKSDRVQSRMVLIAGDLEVPSLKLPQYDDGSEMKGVG